MRETKQLVARGLSFYSIRSLPIRRYLSTEHPQFHLEHMKETHDNVMFIKSVVTMTAHEILNPAVSKLATKEENMATEARLKAEIEKLDTRIDKLDAKIDAKIDGLDAKIDKLDEKLDAKFHALGEKIGELGKEFLTQRTEFYKDQRESSRWKIDSRFALLAASVPLGALMYELHKQGFFTFKASQGSSMEISESNTAVKRS